MPRLISSLLLPRRNERLLKLPPYLSLLCILVGVAWLLMLPLDGYSRRTYISENALLPGQVHTYFGGSDQNIFRAYRHEVDALREKTNIEINDKLGDIFGGIGLKVGRQNYTYHSSGSIFYGENLYAILQAPRGDATEAIVLLSPWKNMKDEMNRSGVALALALTRYFKRWSLWSKDIILVITPDSLAGPQAWVDAYHDSHDSTKVASLPIKSGALQGAVAIDYPQEGRFESVHIIYDGVNGQLPNLDLINSVINIASGQMGMGSTLQEMWRHSDSYDDRLKTMLRGMINQGLGVSKGPHSSFIPYHVDAITIQPFGEGWHDEMGLGRLIEGTFRSLNNLLEKLHQSFFFYLLMQKERFVSIGTYLPSAMLLAANFTIMAIALWVKSGIKQSADTTEEKPGATKIRAVSKNSEIGEQQSTSASATAERDLFLPLGLVAICQFLGAIPLFVFNHTPTSLLAPAFFVLTVVNTILPFVISYGLTSKFHPTAQQYQLITSFSLLLLGMFLSSLATLNFSLAFLVGLLASPLTFMQPWPTFPVLRWINLGFLHILSPPAVIFAGAWLVGMEIGDALKEAAYSWNVWGTYTPVVVWGVWWPAWLASCVTTLGTPRESSKEKTA